MRNITYIFFIMAAIIVLSAGIQKSPGSPGCHAGEPPNFTNCTSCHSDFAVNTGNANILFDVGGADTGYIPGQTYNITVSIKKTGMMAAGFQFIALQDNNISTSPGSITLTQPSRTQKVDASNPHVHGCGLLQKVWVGHTFQGITSDTSGESLWEFDWKAPDNYVGNITFYLAALEANYDGENTGDYTYTRSISSPDITTNVIQPDKPFANLMIFPNPANSKILFVKTGVHDILKIELLNIQGKLIKRFDYTLQDNTTDLQLDLNGISHGVYFVAIQGKEATAVRKIVIQN
jgi:hypothetical protein